MTRHFNSQYTDKAVLEKLGLEKATYAEVLDLLVSKGYYCSVFPVSTFSTQNETAYYPVLVHGNPKNWYMTRKEVSFPLMHSKWESAMDEAIQKAIETIYPKETEH